MKRQFRKTVFVASSIVLVSATGVMLSNCGDDPKPPKFGSVEGTIFLPDSLAAAPVPAGGVEVRLSGGDFDESVTTGSNGRYAFEDVPARSLTLSVTPDGCLADTALTLSVLADDTVTTDVVLLESPCGRVDGTVYSPFDVAAALLPASGVDVRLSGGDYNQTRITGDDGRYAFDEVPSRPLTLTITPDNCLADTSMSVTPLDNDTLSLETTLTVEASTGCLPIPFAGAARMEIHGASNRAVLLYDVTFRPKPAIAVIDLGSGFTRVKVFDDISNVFDLAFVSTNVVAFNCFKAGSGYYMRLFNILTMELSRSDVRYTTNLGTYAGRLAVTPNGADVFVTHRVQSGFDYDGQIYCVNIAQGNLNDADNNASDGNFGFDSALVKGSVNWPYDAAIDPVRHELLVGNYLDTLVIAIDLAFWGTFDRDANLVAPILGVRKIVMAAGTPGFAPWFWNFADGRGVASWPGSGEAPLLAYQSGGATFSQVLVDPGVSLSSDNHHLTIHSVRGTWYSLVLDPSRPQSVREALEERSLTTLSKSARFETRFLETPALKPRAFAVNTQTNRAYVAYTNKAFLEVFQLP